jgi:hypothetical protein
MFHSAVGVDRSKSVGKITAKRTARCH